MSVLEIIIPTGQIIEREMTDEELAHREKEQTNIIAREAAKAEAKSKREAALAKLEALGLDEDDLKALGL